MKDGFCIAAIQSYALGIQGLHDSLQNFCTNLVWYQHFQCPAVMTVPEQLKLFFGVA